MSLPKPHRLRRRQDFQKVYQYGKRHQQVHLTLRSLRHLPDSTTENLPATRFGISVSKTVSKKAVIRNLLKRQVKAALRQMLPRITSGWSVIIGVRPSAQGCEYVEILRELEQLLASAGIFDGH
ncbi:ribonuclease P protein component [Chamaesiphon sp. VAR_48_metabat_135_sub]|uniref:ribonuclease P protein component n=1 Tax=Chamaesiphon sp. VAR_48_metabat_135_sub TaxID=2964699 RepID=UPI00286CCE96|nr:ribonuclease P protein component [Chamaesiphon sp. VAR_48_metabat_135_sub]